MVVANGAGQTLGERRVPTPDSSGPRRVRIEPSSAQGMSGCCSNHVRWLGNEPTDCGAGRRTQGLAGLDITVIPPVVKQMYELWKEGIVSDVAVCARVGMAVEEFRVRLEPEDKRRRCSSEGLEL